MKSSRWIPFNYLPSYVEYYSSGDMHHIIYASDSGQIAGTGYNISQPNTAFLNTYYQIPENNSHVKIVTANAEKDGSFFATFNKNGQNVYIGNLTKTSPHKIILRYDNLTVISAVKWRPGTI